MRITLFIFLFLLESLRVFAVDTASVELVDNQLQVSLSNTSCYVTFQMDIVPPSSMTLDLDNLAATSRLDGFTVQISRLPSGNVRITAYSDSGVSINAGGGVLFTIPVSGIRYGDIVMKNMLFTDSDYEETLIPGLRYTLPSTVRDLSLVIEAVNGGSSSYTLSDVEAIAKSILRKK